MLLSTFMHFAAFLYLNTVWACAIRWCQKQMKKLPIYFFSYMKLNSSFAFVRANQRTQLTEQQMAPSTQTYKCE